MRRALVPTTGLASGATLLSPVSSSTSQVRPDFEAAASAPFHLDRPDGRIAYDDAGQGPLVVLVPGLGDLRAEYRFLAPRLVEAGYRVVSLDLRGHGQSSVGWPDHSAAAVGDDVVALVRHLDAGPAFLVGTSMGAAAVAWAAAETPEHVRGLVLVGPFVRDIPPASKLEGAFFQLAIRVGFARPWGPAAWGGYYALLYPTAKPADFAAYRAALVANLKEPGRLEAAMGMARASKAPIEARLGEVRAPSLVVMGSKDPDFRQGPEAEARLVAERLGGTVHIVDGAGHYPHAEMPDRVLPVLLDFFARSGAV